LVRVCVQQDQNDGWHFVVGLLIANAAQLELRPRFVILAGCQRSTVRGQKLYTGLKIKWGIEMADWKSHEPTEDNVFTEYKCGLTAGQRVRLRKVLIVLDHLGNPTGGVHLEGEIWQVLPGLRSDPVLWFRKPDGNRCT
jgi:hypothetical protein